MLSGTGKNLEAFSHTEQKTVDTANERKIKESKIMQEQKIHNKKKIGNKSTIYQMCVYSNLFPKIKDQNDMQ